LRKMWQVVIRIKRNDEVGGKRLEKVIMDTLMIAHVEGATVWTGVDGYGKRGRSTMHLEGVTVNMPLIIEVVDTQDKLEHLMPELTQLIGENGLITVQEINVV
jgi:PII-like signaling protein